MTLESTYELRPNELYDLLQVQSTQEEIESVINRYFPTINDIDYIISKIESDDTLTQGVVRFLKEILSNQKFLNSLPANIASLPKPSILLSQVTHLTTYEEINNFFLSVFEDNKEVNEYLKFLVLNPTINDADKENLRRVLLSFSLRSDILFLRKKVSTLIAEYREPENPAEVTDKIGTEIKTVLKRVLGYYQKEVLKKLRRDFSEDLGLDHLTLTELVSRIDESDAMKLLPLLQTHPFGIVSISDNEIVFATILRNSTESDKNTFQVSATSWNIPTGTSLATKETLDLISTKYPQNKVWLDSPNALTDNSYNYYLDGEVITERPETSLAIKSPSMTRVLECRVKLK